MKIRGTYLLLILFLGLWPREAKAQELPEILMELLRSDSAYQSLSCKIHIELDVPGLSMPAKEIELKDKESIIEIHNDAKIAPGCFYDFSKSVSGKGDIILFSKKCLAPLILYSTKL